MNGDDGCRVLTLYLAIMHSQQTLLVVTVRVYLLVQTLLLEGCRAEPSVGTVVHGQITQTEEPLTALWTASSGKLCLNSNISLACVPHFP